MRFHVVSLLFFALCMLGETAGASANRFRSHLRRSSTETSAVAQAFHSRQNEVKVSETKEGTSSDGEKQMNGNRKVNESNIISVIPQWFVTMGVIVVATSVATVIGYCVWNRKKKEMEERKRQRFAAPTDGVLGHSSTSQGKKVVNLQEGNPVWQRDAFTGKSRQSNPNFARPMIKNHREYMKKKSTGKFDNPHTLTRNALYPTKKREKV
eukprot:gb/GECG01016566.1/.p1 GENE.gb/GECG01016566.1/~~gb/GECG01016566.1/.p1  ORF type:complete len:210 (+),score=30.68 gb/GECG01016566.1/:1-630(+)